MLLNKHGWGLREMLILSGLLIIFLFIAIYYIYSLYNNFNKEVSYNYYYDLEEKLEEKALIYLSDYYDGILTSDNMVITRNALSLYDLDIALLDRNSNTCDGYVVANKSRGIINKKAYIKCKKYETEGYVE